MAHYCIRYAKNEGRFQACTMLETIEYVQTAPTAFPQNRGRLERIIKHDNLPQSEDSFFLDIWTPETQGKKPILFWIHGGSFVAGASGDKQNDATMLSKIADVVVVSVTYRLGLLGTSYFPDIPQKNCGFHDIVTALKWTHEHIAQFNGDTSNITIGGQSSGAWYAMAIHTASHLQNLFHKTMLFSWPGTMKAITESVATQIARKFKALVPNILSADISHILDAQHIIGKQNKRKYKFNVPLMPVIEDGYISDDFYRDCKNINKPIYLQYTDAECGIYIHNYPIKQHTPLAILVPFIKQYCPENTFKQLRTYRKMTHDSYNAVLQLTSDNLFTNPAKEIADISAPHSTINLFSFPSHDKRIQCCHCFDLPFIFGCFENWSQSIFLKDCDLSAMKKTSLQLQQSIRNFIYSPPTAQ